MVALTQGGGMVKGRGLTTLSRKTVDYSLYLVTDDKFLKDKENVCQTFMSKVREGILGGVKLVQLRLKKADDLYFYKTAMQMKKELQRYNVPLIINNRLDICLSVDADGVHIGKTDLPINIVRKILGEKKMIGATINFSDEKDVEMAINNNVDYIAHEHTLYKSSTKETIASYDQGIKKQIQILRNKVKSLQEKGKISKSLDIALPPIILIGGINTANIEETMATFYNSCAGVAVVSNIIGEHYDSFLNALKLKFVVDKYKKNENMAIAHLWANYLRYFFYKTMESADRGKNRSTDFSVADWLNADGVKTSNREFVTTVPQGKLVTNVNFQKCVYNLVANKLNFETIPLGGTTQRCATDGETIFLFHSKCVNGGKGHYPRDGGGGRNGKGNAYNDSVIEWVEKNKNEKMVNDIFIFIGEELHELFKKKFSSTFFSLNYFFIITRRSQMHTGLFKQFDWDMDTISIEYSHNFIHIVLKNGYFNDDYKVTNLGVLLSYLLIAQGKTLPHFFSRIVGEGALARAGEKWLKFLGAVAIALEISVNECARDEASA
ncbi:thiamin-phosphate pyrophosphorylase, putative [Plasmodium ovale wallikeri]|nr:thiamin-phosphate pyrophosphorylase, putative [Plasmodium ovale wallikeri]SBT39259.1 thiamin-phosphate pyrophosphorylase, putative [Plasmodium ovale wallikeri]